MLKRLNKLEKQYGGAIPFSEMKKDGRKTLKKSINKKNKIKRSKKKTKHINFIFSSGIDFLYEFFNFNKNIENKNLNTVLRFIGKNKTFTNLLVKYADKGIEI